MTEHLSQVRPEKIEDYTLEMMANQFIEYTVPQSASVGQKHDMKCAFVAGMATLAAAQRRYLRETPERVEKILQLREAELTLLIEQYSQPLPDKPS